MSEATTLTPEPMPAPTPAPDRSWKRTVLWTGLGLVGIFVAMQLVPYGWKHSNPPVVSEAPWPSAQVAGLARDACYDCHSNETTWPIYSHVAPVSWWVRQHVDSGRRAVNFSNWPARRWRAREVAEVIQNGSMPPLYYTLMHPAARLSASEKQQLIDALKQMH